MTKFLHSEQHTIKSVKNHLLGIKTTLNVPSNTFTDFFSLQRFLLHESCSCKCWDPYKRTLNRPNILNRNCVPTNQPTFWWAPFGKVILTLYYIMWIPFTSSFYMLYGNGLTINCDPNSEQCQNGNKTILNEMGTYNKAMFFLYSVTLGFSEFDFEKYNEIDSEISEFMAALYIGVTSLIMVNILIALITSTFERISSSSKSLYLLEKAKEIILFEHGLCESSRIKLARRVPDEYYALYKPNLEKEDLGIKNFIKPISDSVKDLNLRFKMQNMFSNILNNSDLERLEKKIDNIESYVSMIANQNNVFIVQIIQKLMFCTSRKIRIHLNKLIKTSQIQEQRLGLVDRLRVTAFEPFKTFFKSVMLSVHNQIVYRSGHGRIAFSNIRDCESVKQ
ncbi:transient receptor potential channel pyrexia-like [Brachionus plicatilis]|uniref:Transient receptor potential channel pyrexia-like n=1 Tax=Brachionus plicatilis TaxID=10195 RepID=A0A3M7S2P6_BRAPC|nr:transient receptor potential channel pyrexia-like [Brachionus plicatilis]